MKFAENIVDMPLDRAFTDDELLSDLVFVKSIGNEFHDIHLPIGQLGKRIYSLAARAVDFLDDTGCNPGV